MKKLIVLAIFAFAVGMAGVARADDSFFKTAPAARNFAAFEYGLLGPWGGGINQDHGLKIGSYSKHVFDTNTALFSVQFVTGGLVDVPIFRVTDWGNVGIGTHNPAAPLDVVGKTITDELTLTLSGTPTTSDTVLLIKADGQVVDSNVSLSSLQAQIDVLKDIINDLPPGLTNIDRNGDGK